MNIHIIIWKDAASVDAWVNSEEITPSHHLIQTAGMLITEDSETVVIGLNHDLTENNWSCFMHIPKSLIVSHVRIEESYACEYPPSKISS